MTTCGRDLERALCLFLPLDVAQAPRAGRGGYFTGAGGGQHLLTREMPQRKRKGKLRTGVAATMEAEGEADQTASTQDQTNVTGQQQSVDDLLALGPSTTPAAQA